MSNITDPSGFVQAILTASSIFLVVSGAFFTSNIFSKHINKSKIKNPKLLRLLIAITFGGGIFAIAFSLMWFFTSSESSAVFLWAIWITFAIQFTGFIATMASFLPSSKQRNNVR